MLTTIDRRTARNALVKTQKLTIKRLRSSIMEKSKVYKVIWILLLSIVFTIDSALFGDDHVPYWAYLIKFVVMASLLTLGQKAMSSGDAETVKDKQRSLLLLSAVSACIICMMVIWIRFT
jgi:hypothetical protein